MSSDFKTWLDLTPEKIEAIIGPIPDWAHQCHAASIKIVQSDLFGRARVARGACRGVGGQHSWVVLFDDCYNDDAPIVDVTLWSYDSTKPPLWKGTISDGLHRPHGYGSIWEYGCPESGGGDEIELVWPQPPSREATKWIDLFRKMTGPLDARFWVTLLSNAPVGDWPAAEVFAAAHNTPPLRAFIPVDMLGMLTDSNPGGLYLRGAA